MNVQGAKKAQFFLPRNFRPRIAEPNGRPETDGTCLGFAKIARIDLGQMSAQGPVHDVTARVYRIKGF